MTNQDTQNLGSLRPMTDQDLEMVLEWRNAPKVRENMYTQQVITLGEHQNWWARVKDSDNARYLVFEANTIPAGVVSFVNFRVNPDTAEWGFYTAPTALKGAGSDLGLSALDYAFGTLSLKLLYGEILEYNSSSLGFHKKLGFQDQTLLENHKLVNGVQTNVYRLAISADQWRQVRPLLLAKRLRRPRHV